MTSSNPLAVFDAALVCFAIACVIAAIAVVAFDCIRHHRKDRAS